MKFTDVGKREVEAFLTHLAVNRAVSPSTQNQALQALLFLYRMVLEIDLPWLEDVVRAKPKRRLPVVLSRSETRALLAAVKPSMQLPVSLMYGSGLRVMECLRLRVGNLRGGGSGGHSQAGDLSHAPPFLRHPPAGVGDRHPHDPATAGA
jgi:integrase